MSQKKSRILITIMLLVWILMPGQEIRAEAINTLPDEIVNHWIHSHEDDTSDTFVFRPSTYKFPSSRGRRGLEFKKNGEFFEYRIAPADGLIKLPGRWELIDENRILIKLKDEKFEPYEIVVVSVSRDMLKIKNK